MFAPARHRISVLDVLRATLATVLLWPARVAAARRVLQQTSGMSDCELRDIGLSRQDVWDATTLPLAADPGRLFQARVHERLQARRAGQSAMSAPPTAPDLPDAPRRGPASRVLNTNSGRRAPTIASFTLR